jgi:hypothetical protein
VGVQNTRTNAEAPESTPCPTLTTHPASLKALPLVLDTYEPLYVCVGYSGWGYKILVLMLTYEEGRAFGLSLPSLSLESVEPRHNGTYNT